MNWFRGIRRWGKRVVERVRRRTERHAATPHSGRDENLEREIERAHAMRVGEPLEQPSRH